MTEQDIERILAAITTTRQAEKAYAEHAEHFTEDEIARAIHYLTMPHELSPALLLVRRLHALRSSLCRQSEARVEVSDRDAQAWIDQWR